MYQTFITWRIFCLDLFSTSINNNKWWFYITSTVKDTDNSKNTICVSRFLKTKAKTNKYIFGNNVTKFIALRKTILFYLREKETNKCIYSQQWILFTSSFSNLTMILCRMETKNHVLVSYTKPSLLLEFCTVIYRNK